MLAAFGVNFIIAACFVGGEDDLASEFVDVLRGVRNVDLDLSVVHELRQSLLEFRVRKLWLQVSLSIELGSLQ